MAVNNVHRKGFRFFKSLHGSGKMMVERIELASAYRPTLTISASPVYVNMRPGDPILRLSTGYGDLAFGTESDTPSTRVLGVVVGFSPLWDGSSFLFQNYYPNAGITYGSVVDRTTYVYYIPAHTALFEVDVDDATTATTFASYLAFQGETCRHVFNDSANNETNTMLDISDHNTTATFTWRIEKFIQSDPNNQDFAGSYVKAIVSCNTPQISSGSTTGI